MSIRHSQYAETERQRHLEFFRNISVVSAIISIIGTALSRGVLESLTATRLVVRAQMPRIMKRPEQVKRGVPGFFAKKESERLIEDIYEGDAGDFEKIIRALAWYYRICQEFFPWKLDELQKWPLGLIFPSPKMRIPRSSPCSP